MSSSTDAEAEGRDRLRPVTRELAGLKLDELLMGVQTRLSEISRTGDRLQSLLDAVLAVSGELDLDTTLHRIARVALELVAGRSCTLTVFDPEGGPADTVVANADPDEPVPRVPQARDPESGTALVVPVRVRAETFGRLHVNDKRDGGQFNAEDDIVLRALAAAAGVAVDNARLFERSRVRGRWLEAVATVNAGLLAGASPAESLSRIAELARELSGADATVVLLDKGGDALAVGAVSGPVRQLDPGVLVAAGPVLTEVLRTVEPTVLADLAQAPTSLPASITEAFGPAVVSPLRNADGVQGLLVAVRARDSARFSRQEVSMTSSFATQATLALQFADKQDSERAITLLADRDRIAQDLHDHVIQRLFATGMSLQGVLRQVGGDAFAAERIGDAVKRLDQTVREIRTSIFNLHSMGGTVSDSLRRRLLDVVSALPEGAPVPSVRIGGALDTLVPAPLGRVLESVVRESIGRLVRRAGEGGATPEIVLDIEVDDRVTVDVSAEGLPMPPGQEWVRRLRGRAEDHGGWVRFEQQEGAARLVWTVPLPDADSKPS